jgi:hypothetical protein
MYPADRLERTESRGDVRATVLRDLEVFDCWHAGSGRGGLQPSASPTDAFIAAKLDPIEPESLPDYPLHVKDEVSIATHNGGV